MKAVILAGGVSRQFSQESDSKDEPVIEIGGKPHLWPKPCQKLQAVLAGRVDTLGIRAIPLLRSSRNGTSFGTLQPSKVTSTLWKPVSRLANRRAGGIEQARAGAYLQPGWRMP